MPQKIALSILVALGLVQLIASSVQAADPSLILDESAWWRRCYRFGVNRYSAAALKAEGKAILGPQGLARLQRDTEKQMRDVGLHPARADWRENVTQPIFRHFAPAPQSPPPADWAGVEFDDRTWILQQGPFQSSASEITNPVLGQFDERTQDLQLQAAWYRGRFVVDDPPKAGRLTLRLVYSGGVRVLLNGREIARGHLPAGDLDADTPGDDYPAAVYADAGAGQRDRTLGPVTIPPDALRQGVNVLAVELRASRFHPIVLTNPRQANWGGPTRPWPHGRLSKLELRGSPAGVHSALARPAGVQVYAADMHRRVESSDFLPAGEEPGTVRIVGARGGTYSAQIVVAADKALADLAVAPGELRAAAGDARLPAAAWHAQHMVLFPADQWTLKRLGDERGLAATFPAAAELAGYARGAVGSRKAMLFDQLTDAAPPTVPAGTARPVWLSLTVPADAAPGTYAGSVAVSAAGIDAVSLPVEVEVVDWRLPEPRDFRTLVAGEENPYGVAAQYGVAPWSDEHFRLLEASFRQLGRIGNRWLNVPVLVNTEFGNKGDSPIRWIRRRDGSLTFDYATLDRYLDLATKHCGPPRVINVIVMQGMPDRDGTQPPPQVRVFDEGGRTSKLVAVGGKGLSPAEKRALWNAFAASLYDHLKSRGLDKAMYWGYPLENEADPELKDILAQAAPQVFWTTGPHEMMSNAKYAKNDRFYKVHGLIRYWGGWPAFRDDEGWKSKAVHLAIPRVGGTCFALHTTSLPFAYRVLPDRALATGRSGFTRVGMDEWAAVHYQGMVTPKYLTGIPVLFTLWPGKDGAEPSARFEALLEGIQEAEARIFIEQQIDAGKLPRDLANRAKAVLADNFAETTFFQGNSMHRSLEENHFRWQDRSRQLYRMAAEVAAGKGTP